MSNSLNFFVCILLFVCTLYLSCMCFVVPIGAFRSWMGHVTRMRQAAKVLRKMRNSQLSYSWRSWRDAVQLRGHRESVMTKIVRKMTHGLLSDAWRLWRDVVQYSERCECMMTKVVRRMTHGFLVRGMSCCLQMERFDLCLDLHLITVCMSRLIRMGEMA